MSRNTQRHFSPRQAIVDSHRSSNDTNMTTLANLKNSMQDRIYDIEALLDEAPQATAQESEQIGYILKITDLTSEATTKLRDIEARQGGGIEYIELDTFRASLNNIKNNINSNKSWKSRIYAAIHAQNVEEITSIDNKARAGELQDILRAQQCTTGKPNTQTRNLDTALPTPVLPEEHHDTADGEDHKQKEAAEDH